MARNGQVGDLGVQIRPFRKSDASEVSLLIHQLGYRAAVEHVIDRMKAIEADAGAEVFVAQLDGAVVGWLSVAAMNRLQTAPFAEITGLAVSDSHRSMGIGGLLVTEAERWAVSMGFGAVRVRSRSSRESAHAFYLARGYDIVKDQTVFSKDL